MMAYEDQPAAFFPAAIDTNNKLSLGDGRSRSDPVPPSFTSKLPATAGFRREAGATSSAVAHNGSPRFDDGGGIMGLVQEQPSVVAGSLNAFLNSAYADGPAAGEAAGGGGGSLRASSVGVGGGGGGGRSVFGGGVGGGPLRQLIETKERELHEIHDFRLRYVGNACVFVFEVARGWGMWQLVRF